MDHQAHEVVGVSASPGHHLRADQYPLGLVAFLLVVRMQAVCGSEAAADIAAGRSAILELAVYRQERNAGDGPRLVLDAVLEITAHYVDDADNAPWFPECHVATEDPSGRMADRYPRHSRQLRSGGLLSQIAQRLFEMLFAVGFRVAENGVEVRFEVYDAQPFVACGFADDRLGAYSRFEANLAGQYQTADLAGALRQPEVRDRRFLRLASSIRARECYCRIPLAFGYRFGLQCDAGGYACDQGQRCYYD